MFWGKLFDSTESGFPYLQKCNIQLHRVVRFEIKYVTLLARSIWNVITVHPIPDLQGSPASPLPLHMKEASVQ